MYTLLQIVVTAGIFAITFTPAAPVFPVIIVLLVPIRLNVMNKWWSRETLKRESTILAFPITKDKSPHPHPGILRGDHRHTSEKPR